MIKITKKQEKNRKKRQFFDKLIDIYLYFVVYYQHALLVESLPAPLGAVSTATVAKPVHNAIRSDALHRYKLFTKQNRRTVSQKQSVLIYCRICFLGECLIAFVLRVYCIYLQGLLHLLIGGSGNKLVSDAACLAGTIVTNNSRTKLRGCHWILLYLYIDRKVR